LKPVYYDPQLLRKETEIPVLGQVSRVWTSDVALKRRVEVAGFGVSVTLLLVVFVVVLLTYKLGYREEIVTNLKLMLETTT
jgi:hypothetical protein